MFYLFIYDIYLFNVEDCKNLLRSIALHICFDSSSCQDTYTSPLCNKLDI